MHSIRDSEEENDAENFGKNKYCSQVPSFWEIYQLQDILGTLQKRKSDQ